MDKKSFILLVEDDETALQDLMLMLKRDYELETAVDFNSALLKLKENYFDVIVADLKLASQKSGLDVIKYAQKNNRAYGYILITGYSDEQSIIEALNIGVNNLLKKPFSSKELIMMIKKIIKLKELEEENEILKNKLRKENEILKEQIKVQETQNRIIGKSKVLKDVLLKAEEIARYSEPCLIIGESGTGKEMIAKYIHQKGNRKNKPFIVLHCPTISPSLFESELFGYIKGAFTGANESVPGLFKVADGGVIFLDEITEIPLNLQTKLLRVIELKEFRPVGSTKYSKIDVQIIASTNRNINELQDNKIIRLDLLHRISATSLMLLPLRERKEDIPLLFKYFVEMFARKFKKNLPEIDKGLIKTLMEKNWPGNVRQLKNYARNYVLFNEINIDMSDNLLWDNLMEEDEDIVFKFKKLNLSEINEAKLMVIKQLLKKYNNNKSRAARHFGMSYPGFFELLKKLGIN